MGRRSLLAVMVGAVALVAAGCAGSAASTAEGDRLQVVATTTQLTDFTANVGGDRIELTGILRPNVDAHDFDPTPADLDALGSAAVLVTNGVELESWLDDAVAASGFDGLRTDTSEGVTLLEGPEDLHSEENGHAEEEGHDAEDADHTEEADGDHAEEADHEDEADHAEEEGEADHAEGEEGHDHGEFDPHIWQNPQNAEIMVRNIERALVEADPDGADAYRANADDYVDQLRELDAEVAEQLAALSNRQLVTNHEAFTYYVDRYDLEFVGSIIPSFDTQAELSTQEVNELVAEIRATGVKAVFSEASLSPDTARTIADEAGVEVIAGDDALYGDSLGPEGSPGATYLDAIRHNTETIVARLG